MEYKDSTGKIWVPTVTDTVQWRMTAYAAIVQDGKVLLVKSDHATFFALPGGGVEMSESIHEGLKRECKEEIGYNVEIAVVPFCIIESRFYLNGFFHSVNMIYKTLIVGGSAEEAQPESDEVVKVEWKNLADCTKENIYGHIYPAFEALQRMN